MSLEGEILSFVGEKWQNLPFLGITRNSVHVPKGGYRYPWDRGKVVLVPTHQKGLVPISIKVVPVPMLPTALIFVSVHC